MIARIWHGRVPSSKADEYDVYLRETGIADYRATEGNLGVYVLRRIEEDVAHFELVTFWESIDAIKEFAGKDYEVARYYDQDDGFLLERELFVRHYEVRHADPKP